MQLPFIFFLLVCFVVGQKASAQYDEKDFTRYSVANGLSDNRITCLQQDDWGYMWIGTESGLNRFDGTSFRNYYQGDAPVSLPASFVTRFKSFGPHRLGIFTRGGFQVFDTKNYKAHQYRIPDSTAFTTYLNAAWDATLLPDGSFGLTTAAGFYVLNEKGIQQRYDAFHLGDMGRKRILYGRDILSVGDDQYIVYTNEEGQALYNHHRKTFVPLTDADVQWSAYLNPKQHPGGGWLTRGQINETEALFIPYYSDSIYYYNRITSRRVASKLPFPAVKELYWASHLLPLNDSTLLINCGSTGFYKLALNKKSGIVSGDGKKFLPGYEVICLYVDKDNRLWAGTTQGLLKQELTPPFIRTTTYQISTGVYNSEFNTLFNYNGRLYTGAYSRDHGLHVLNAATMQVEKKVQFFGNNTPWNEVLSIQMYHRDTLWIGTWAGVLWYDIKSGRYGKVWDEKKEPWAADFSAILAPPQKDGYAWICAWLGGRVVRYHIPSHTATVFTSQTSPALPFNKVKSIAYDSYGDVWIGGHALARWSNQQQRFDTLITRYAGANPYNDDITSLYADDRGSLWIHNADNGILEYRIAEKKWLAYSIKDGLPSTTVNAMSQPIHDKLWIVSGNRLCLMDTRTHRFAMYDQSDGLPEQSPTSSSIFFDAETAQHYMLFKNSIARFPLMPEQKIDHSSALLLERISINNDSSIYQPADVIIVKHDEANLRFDLAVVDFEHAAYRFAYRLNGGNWNTVGSQGSIVFNNLSPGNYDVEFKATGKAGIDKTKNFHLLVKAPFWLRTPFLIIVSALILGFIYLLFRLRVKGIRQKANLDRLLSQTEMKALQAQMNPHFIFNSLNSIREMILSNENKEASHYLSKFAHLIRLTLDQSTQEAVSLRSTIDYLKRYMEMETIRNGQLTYEINVDNVLDPDETFVSPTLIQPFIENAIWHGVSVLRKNIHVCVSFSKQDDVLVCVIEDDGVGISHGQSMHSQSDTRHQSHGIANIRNRIRLLNEKYNLACDVNIADKKERGNNAESGTLVTLRLPLQINEV